MCSLFFLLAASMFSAFRKNRVKVCVHGTSDVAHIRLRSGSEEPRHVYISSTAISIPIGDSRKNLEFSGSENKVMRKFRAA